MLLRFSDPAKLKTKRIIFENAFHARDPVTLEELKELSSQRKLIEDSINERSLFTEAIAREMSGGLTSKVQQDLRRLEFYLPILENLVIWVELEKSKRLMLQWTSDLKIRWSSAMIESPTFHLGGPKFFSIDHLSFELGMSTYLYAALLRERAFETEELVESAAFYMKAAGVYEYLAYEALLPLQSLKTKERPPESIPSMSYIMSLICLADAQSVAIKRSEELGGSSSVLSKLHYGVTQMLDEAAAILRRDAGDLNDVSSRLVEFIATSSILHQLRSQRYFAEDLRKRCQSKNADGLLGVAIAVLRNARASAHNVKSPRNDAWRRVFYQEVTDMENLLKKFEDENNFIYHDRLPYDDQIPTLEGTRLVKSTPYKPQRVGRPLDFQV